MAHVKCENYHVSRDLLVWNQNFVCLLDTGIDFLLPVAGSCRHASGVPGSLHKQLQPMSMPRAGASTIAQRKEHLRVSEK